MDGHRPEAFSLKTDVDLLEELSREIGKRYVLSSSIRSQPIWAAADGKAMSRPEKLLRPFGRRDVPTGSV